MSKRRRNPQEFTIDEIKTATRLVDEGYALCVRERGYTYPALEIKMCDKEALVPVQKVFGTSIIASRVKKRRCPDHLFPPDGKGMWRIRVVGTKAREIAQRLNPLFTQEFRRKLRQSHARCP